MAIDTKGAAWSEHGNLYALPKALIGGTAAMRQAGQTYLSKGSAEPQVIQCLSTRNVDLIFVLPGAGNLKMPETAQEVIIHEHEQHDRERDS